MDGPPAVVALPPSDRADRTVAALADAGVDAGAVGVGAAMAALVERPPDCVVCLDGDDRTATELLAGVRERRPAVPAVVVGGDPLLAGPATQVAPADTPAVVEAVQSAVDDAPDGSGGVEPPSAVRAERDRLSALFENVPIPVVRVDHRDGEPYVQEVNPAFEEVFGYPAADIVGENVDDYVLPDDQTVAASVKSEAAAGETITREVRRETADGLRDFLLTTAPVDPGTDDGQAYGFYIDVTERRQRRQRLRVLSRVLRHDIRNRMNVIDGNAELVAERAADDDVRAPADRIQEAATELLSLSDRTRRLERTVARAGAATARELDAVVDAVVADARERYPSATVAADADVAVPVRSADAVEVALTELVENAIEHSDRAAPSVVVTAAASEDAVTVTVADDGPGIPKREQALVDGDREPTQLEHASGIGLWMVKWVVTALGGVVSMDDHDPRGTEVTVWLPRIPED